MKIISLNKSITFILFQLLFLINTFAQQNKLDLNCFHFPSGNEKWQFKNILSLSLSQLPEDIIEEVNSLIYSPLISYDAKIGIPYNFSINGSITTNFITNHFSFGVNWNYQKNRFAISPGYNIAFWFGILEDFDFSSRNVGWLHYPNLTLGYAFEKATVSLRSEIILNTFYTQFVDNIEVTTERNTISGYSLALYVEQPLWKNHFMSIGFKANFSRFYYSAWLAYTNSVQFRFIPEVQIGLIL
ncbi:MAG: hypothetical protein KDC88_13835 [Ignavibacteriae bacterium]|nr:hypothetical protein [Ignavibacteriota bacterium]MCB9260109.1 hypothetical protein [Ignavibacteriales bacterium]